MANLEIERDKSPYPPITTTSESQIDFLLLERLRNLIPTFLRIKNQMKPDCNIGFGSLPQFHPDSFATGIMGPLKKTNGDLLSQIDTEDGFFSEEVKLTEIDKSGIIIMPNFKRENPHIISLYQKSVGDKTVDQQLLNAPDEVIEGIIAHELAHLLVSDYRLPKSIEIFLDERYNEKEEAYSRLKRPKKYGLKRYIKRNRKIYNKFQLESEGVFDVAAALFGFKKQILAMLSFMQSSVAAHDKIKSVAHPNTSSVLRQIKSRIKMVEKYCP